MSYRLNTHISSDIDVPSYEKRLSICLRPNGFSFSVATSQYLLEFGQALHEGAADMVSLSNDIKALFQSLGIQPFAFQKVELVVPSDMSTWVPDELYAEDHKALYLNLLYGSAPLGSMVYVDPSAELQSRQLFVAESGMVTAFKIALPGIVVRSQFSKFSESDLLDSPSPAILMYVRSGMVDIQVSHAGKMLMSTSFDFATSADLLSIGVDVMQQLQIETPSTILWLAGEVGRDIYKALCDYFPQVRLYTGRKRQFGNPEFQHLHTYQFVLNLI